MMLGMDLNENPETQLDLVQAKQDGWRDAHDLQQERDGRPRAFTYSEDSTWRTGALSVIDAMILNAEAALLFEEFQVIETLDIKKHRPLMTVLRTDNLDQMIDVISAPKPFPVETMLAI